MIPHLEKFASVFQKKFLVTAVLVLVIIFGGVQLYRLSRDAAAVHREYVRMSGSMEILAERNRELEAYLVELDTPEVVERLAKERLNLKKEGEEVVIVVPEKQEKKNQSAASDETWWLRVRNFFMRNSASR